MRIIKPKKLQKGDTIGIIAPASTVDDPQKISRSVEYFQRLGYKVKLGKYIEQRRGYLAGSDAERLDDLHTMFSDKSVRAIFALRGGYGCGRIIESLDYDLIRKNPKIFVGYSDLTILQNAILAKAGLVTFSGPMAASDFSGDVNRYTEEIFWKQVTSGKKLGDVQNPAGSELFTMNDRSGSGVLIGGNFANFNALLGTDFLPEFRSTILFLEEINEPPYKIDRMFNHLKMSGVLNSVKGIILGRFVNCNTSDVQKYTLSLKEVFDDYLCDLPIPVIYNVQIGHTAAKLTFPIGLRVKIYSNRKSIEFESSAVR